MSPSAHRPPRGAALPSPDPRVAVFAALGDAVRLRIVDDLACSDRSPTELSRRHGLSSNLLAHHLDVLEAAGLIGRGASAGDARRRYVHLRHDRVAGLGVGRRCEGHAQRQMVFLCTHNSARSQLAAALWARRSGSAALSAGTDPAPEVHRLARQVGDRWGLDLAKAQPQMLDAELLTLPGAQVVTVCDRVHEDLTVGRDQDRDQERDWWHWSIPDPVEVGTEAAFDAVLAELDLRIGAVMEAGAGA